MKFVFNILQRTATQRTNCKFNLVTYVNVIEVILTVVLTESPLLRLIILRKTMQSDKHQIIMFNF